jgi:hypothetical protein
MRICVLLLAVGFVGCAGEARMARYFEAHLEAEIAALIARGTPRSLATAAVLLNFKTDSRSPTLIDRAVAMAPADAKLIYLQWGECARHQCADEQKIIEHLKAADPGNGLAWLPELNAARERKSEAEITQLLATIGATRGLSFYWNPLNVMMVDALNENVPPEDRAAPGENLSARGVTVIGVLAALAIPPLQSLGKSCRLDQFDQLGRRAACEAMTARLSESDTVIMQGLGISIQQKWWPEGSPERERLREQRRQYDYLVEESTRPRFFGMNRDWAARFEAMRNFRSEADVERAMLIFHHEPLERPVNWKDPYPHGE